MGAEKKRQKKAKIDKSSANVPTILFERQIDFFLKKKLMCFIIEMKIFRYSIELHKIILFFFIRWQFININDQLYFSIRLNSVRFSLFSVSLLIFIEIKRDSGRYR